MADSVERTPAVVLDGGAGKGGPRGQQVVEILRSAIIMGTYEPGERLIEATLSTELGTSRGPVREALRQLENEGLVMSYPYRGRRRPRRLRRGGAGGADPDPAHARALQLRARARADDGGGLRRARQAGLADGAGGRRRTTSRATSRPTSASTRS